jgi:hypothetical protein
MASRVCVHLFSWTSFTHLLQKKTRREIITAYRGAMFICESEIYANVNERKERLKVLPATRLCRKCAQKYEKEQVMRQHLRDEIVDEELLDEYRSLNDETESIKKNK